MRPRMPPIDPYSGSSQSRRAFLKTLALALPAAALSAWGCDDRERQPVPPNGGADGDNRDAPRGNDTPTGGPPAAPRGIVDPDPPYPAMRADEAPIVKTLLGVVDRFASDAARDTPWAIAHGLLVKRRRGLPDAPAALVRLARLEPTTDGRQVHAFAKRAGGVPAATHSNLFLKALVSAGVPVATTFAAPSGQVSLAQLIDEARRAFRFEPPRLRNDLAWTLETFAATTPLLARTWTNDWGERIDLDALTSHGLDVLVELSKPIAGWRAERAPYRVSEMHRFTCGGLHLLQGVQGAIGRGFGHDGDRERFQTTMDLLFTRMELEPKLYDAAHGVRDGQAPAEPIKAIMYHRDRFKFFGHVLEALGDARLLGVVRDDETHRQALAVGRARMREQFLGTAQALADLRLWPFLGRWRNASDRIQRQLYRDFVGDTCHGLRGVLADVD